MVSEARKNLYSKYGDVFTAMANAGEDGDNSVLFDKLKYMYDVHIGKFSGEDHEDYKGIPEDFDWDTFGEEIKGLE